MSKPEYKHPVFELGRRAWTLTVLPYGLLAFCAGLTVVIKGPGGSLWIDLGLCALAAAWMLVMFTLRPVPRQSPRAMAVFLAGVIVILAVLVVRDPWFGFWTPAGYFYAFNLLKWPWRLPAVSAVAILAGTAQSYGVDKKTLGGVVLWLAVVALNVLLIAGGAAISRHGDLQSELRDQALAETREANRKLEATLAENAGLHEQLLTQAREAGRLDERQRMAREIHDTLAQGLTGIITQLQASEQDGQDPAGRSRHVQAAISLARDSLTEARRSVDALRPEPLETARLGGALADVAQRWAALHGIAVQVATTGTVRPMSPDAEVTLLRTAQEALANVAKHASATRVGLTLSYLKDEVALDVRDDGQGFDPAAVSRPVPVPVAASVKNAVTGANSTNSADGHDRASGGFGLVAMRQRIENLAGTLQIESEPGSGTAISACIPAAAEAGA
jgi:signal transduction histidine kinase